MMDPEIIENIKALFRSLSLDEHAGDVANTLKQFAPQFGLQMEYSDIQGRMVFTDEVYCGDCGLTKEESDEYYEGECECDEPPQWTTVKDEMG